jgi:diguanylate cyclase (GGDEF)-like protein/PAS domain S-box-containing protein
VAYPHFTSILQARKPGERRQARHAAALLALLALLAGLACYLVFRELVANEDRQIQDTLHHIADIRSAAVVAWVRERVNDASVFGGGRFLGETVDDWEQRGQPDDRTARQIRSQLDTLKKVYGYLQVSVLDENGRPRISSEATAAHINVLEQGMVKRALTEGKVQVSSIRAAPGTLIDIVAPLYNPRARETGGASVLFLQANAALPLDVFARSIPLANVPTETLLAEVVDGRVSIASAGTGGSRFASLDALPLTPAQLEAAAARQAGSLFLTDAHGNTLLSAVRKVDSTPWYLITMVDQHAVQANMHRLGWSVGLAWAIVTLLLASLVLSWWRKEESELRLQTLRAQGERQRLQRQYDYLSRYANDMIVLADGDDRILEVNYKTLQVLGERTENLVGAPLARLFPLSDRHQLAEMLAALRREGTAFFETEQMRADGTALPVEISARAIRQGNQQLLQLICRDVSERKRAEAALRESQERLNGILTSILDMIWSFSADMKTLNYINPAGERMLGRSRAELTADPGLWFKAIHPDDRQRIEQVLGSLGPDHLSCEAEYRITDAAGELRWLHCRGSLVLDSDGTPLRIDGVGTDITQRKRAEQQVHQLAYYDNVTGLPNRALLNDRLAQAVRMAMRNRKKLAVLFMDLDNFKNINDSLGHQVGDMLLRAVADSLHHCVRAEDTVGRLGGDEFLVILQDIEQGEQAIPVAEKILAAMARPFMLAGQEVHTTGSVGISIFPDDGQTPDDLIRQADSALYQAKGRGRDNYQFFTEELNRQISRTSAIERQLRQAVDNEALSVWYQPQIDAATGQLVGAEALLRWRHDDRDFLTPVEFIPVAEERGLIGRIGEWVLREACRQSSQWQAQGLQPVRISVNVSPLQFQQKGFAKLVTDILRETRLDASWLELEITESSIMRRAPLVASLATTLRESGVRISIDDFGTGYSSLSYLKHIPIDKIKIDRSFVTDMLDDKDDESITYAIISLAHSLNLRVIAEGVESQAQLERLQTFGCDEIQGNYYSPAVSAEDFQEFLRRLADSETAPA